MWWKSYTDTQPKFVKAWNSKKKGEKGPLTDEVERMAWNYHYSYLYNQMIFEWSEGYGRLELITKEYLPTGCHLPKLIETDKNKPVNPDILKQRYNLDQQSYMTAPVNLFSNPFFVASLCISDEELEKSIERQEREMRLEGLSSEEKPKEKMGQLALF